MKAKPKKGIDNEFLYYFLKQDALFRYVDKLSPRTGGQTGVDVDALNKYPVRIPKLEEHQKKLVASLIAIDARISLNNRINAEFEAMAKTLYDYWFVQFDFPDNNGKPYKSSGGKMVYNDVLKRVLPLGWEVKHLKETTLNITRGVPPEYTSSGGASILNQKCIRNNSINFRFSKRHSNTINESKILQFGDVLVNSTGVGTLGRVAFVKRLEENITTVDSHVTIVRANLNIIKKYYFCYSILYKQSEIEKSAEGTTGQVELSRDQLEQLKMIVPKITLQLKFEAFVEPIVQRIAFLEQENQQLTQLRDWLLPMLMNGQVKVTSDKIKKAAAAA